MTFVSPDSPNRDKIYEPLKGTWTSMNQNNFLQYLTHMRLDHNSFPKVVLSTIHKEEQVSEALKVSSARCQNLQPPKKLAAERILSLPTVDDEGLPIGILSMKSVVRRFVANKEKPQDQALEETMKGRVKETVSTKLFCFAHCCRN
jgi:hypothetical protein